MKIIYFDVCTVHHVQFIIQTDKYTLHLYTHTHTYIYIYIYISTFNLSDDILLALHIL